MYIEIIPKVIEYLEKIKYSKWYMEFESNFENNDYRKNNPEEYKLICKNKKLFQKHKGERCFILGNGPSLNTVDFKSLSNEIVFTVNQLMLHPNFEELNSNYHFAIDAALFGLRKDVTGLEQRYLNLLKGLKEKGNPTLVVPIDVRKVIRRKKIDDILDINYIRGGKEYFYKGYHNTDICKAVPIFTTVVQYAILTAIYMGFKEIYLLGCDTTVLKYMLDIALDIEVGGIHAYNNLEEEKIDANVYKEVLHKRKLSYYLEDINILLKGYEELNKFCKEKKISLINLSEVTLIDTIERKSIKDVLNKG